MIKGLIPNRKKLHYRKKLFHVNFLSQSNQSILCNCCGHFIAPFNAFKAYLNIDIGQYRLGNNFLVGDRYNYQHLVINEEGEIFDTEEPFVMMHLRPVHCRACWSVIGLFFQSCNVYGTEWLLDCVALNMDKLRLGDKASNMDHVIDSLFKLLTTIQTEKLEHPVAYHRIKKKAQQKQFKKKSIETEKSLQRNILECTDLTLPQNKNKGVLVRQIIDRFAFFDRMTQRLELQLKKIADRSEGLKYQIVNRYEELLKFKSKTMKSRNNES